VHVLSSDPDHASLVRRRLQCVILAVVASVGTTASAATLTRGPYLQLLTTRGVTVVWKTDVAASCAVGVRPLGGATTVYVGGRGTLCAIPVGNLAAGVQYGYTPRADGVAIGGESIFRTDDPRRPFSFLVVGDHGTGDASQRAVRDRMVALPADFVLSTGDMIYEDGSAADFDPEFFVPYRDLIRRFVFWPTLGNHDVGTAAGQPWRDAFYTPANNAAGSENYYSFDFGNAHVAVLDSNASTSPGSAQYTFLDRDLGATTARWKLVAFHHTIYSSGTTHGSNTTLRTNLVPLFDAHAVDVVFMGHEHNYERTKPLRADQIVSACDGTVYVTTGGGGRDLHPVGSSSFTAHAESSHHFTQVSVDGASLSARMIRDDGTVGDAMTIAKGTPGTAACPSAPRPGCQPAAPRSATVLVHEGAFAARDQVVWKWTQPSGGSVADFGDPSAGSDYLFCIYDAHGLALGALAPADHCAARPRWHARPGGFQYRDSSLSPDGIARIQLKVRGAGGAKIALRGRGAALDIPALPLARPVRVQLLRNDAAQCWEARYSTATMNGASAFAARSD